MGTKHACCGGGPRNLQKQIKDIINYEVSAEQMENFQKKADYYLKSQDYNSAINMYFQTLEIQKLIQDKNIQLKLSTLKKIAECYEYMEDKFNALKIYMDALQLYTHEDISEIDYNNKIYCIEVGQQTQFLDYCQMIQQKYRNQCYIMNRRFNLLKYHILYQKSIMITMMYDKQIKIIIEILYNLAKTYLNQQNFEKAHKYLEYCFIQYQKMQDENQNFQFKIKKADILYEIGQVSDQIQNYDNALDYYNKSLNLYIQNDDLDKQATLMNNISVVLFNKMDLENSIKFCQQSLELRIKLNGKNNLETLEVYNNLAILYDDAQKYQQAIQTYLQIKKIREDYYLYDQHQIGKVLANIANSYIQMDQFEEALEYQLQSLKIKQSRKQSDFQNIFELGECLFNVGYIYKNLEQYFKSIEYLVQSIETLTQNYSENTDYIMKILNLNAQNYLKLHMNDQAIDCYKEYLLILSTKPNSEQDQMEVMETIQLIQSQ